MNQSQSKQGTSAGREGTNTPSSGSAQSGQFLAPPSQDQEQYLDSVKHAGTNYDRNVIVGGPRRTR